jgi:hypothetical protein
MGAVSQGEVRFDDELLAVERARALIDEGGQVLLDEAEGYSEWLPPRHIDRVAVFKEEEEECPEEEESRS